MTPELEIPSTITTSSAIELRAEAPHVWFNSAGQVRASLTLGIAEIFFRSLDDASLLAKACLEIAGLAGDQAVAP